MRTIKEILNSGEQIDEYNILLKDGTLVEGILIQERVDKEHDTEGYNIYDMRTGWSSDGIEIPYCTLEPNVWVDWADSIATKQTLDFGKDDCLEIDNEDLLEWERDRIESSDNDFDD